MFDKNDLVSDGFEIVSSVMIIVFETEVSTLSVENIKNKPSIILDSFDLKSKCIDIFMNDYNGEDYEIFRWFITFLVSKTYESFIENYEWEPYISKFINDNGHPINGLLGHLQQ